MKHLLLATIAALGIAGPAFAQPGTPCVIAAPPEPWAAGVVLNVRAVPNGPILGSLWNGTPVVLVGPESGNWAVIDNGYGLVGWAFAPYLACTVPPLPLAVPVPPPPLPPPPQLVPCPNFACSVLSTPGMPPPRLPPLNGNGPLVNGNGNGEPSADEQAEELRRQAAEFCRRYPSHKECRR